MIENKVDEFVSGIVYLEAQRIIPTVKEVRAYKIQIQFNEDSKEAYAISVKYGAKDTDLYFHFNLLREYLIDVAEKLEYFGKKIDAQFGVITKNYAKDNPFRKELVEFLKEQQSNKEFHLLGETVENSDYTEEIRQVYMKELNPLECLKKMRKVEIKDESNQIIKKQRKIRPLTLIKEKLTKTTKTPLKPR